MLSSKVAAHGCDDLTTTTKRQGEELFFLMA